MKKIVLLNLNVTGDIQRYLDKLKNILTTKGVASEVRIFDSKQTLSPHKKLLKYNKQVRIQKNSDVIYFSLECVDSADIYKVTNGIYRSLTKLKKFWFLNPINYIYPYLEKKCFNNAKLIIANSNMIKEQIVATYKIDTNKIITIHNGISLPNSVQKGRAKMELCNKLGYDYELPILLFVGSGFARKGVREFLELISRLKHKVTPIIVGDDKHIQQYINLAKSLNVNAIFTGAQKIVKDYYEAADIFIFPTHYDSFSNVVLEALSYGCIAITTAQNGASEILEKRFVMEHPCDYNITSLIDILLDDANTLATLSQNNIELATSYTIERNIQKTLEAIDTYIH